ncbi:MAG: GNAT family N-acetyltransferase [Candidatus Gastranaerophilaceae bacterium]
MKINQITYRKETKESDLEDFREVLSSSGFFYEYEIEAAEDFLKYQLEDGDESGVYYYMAEDNGKMIGFICFGFDSCTVHTYILYWMAIHNDYRGKGIGKVLLKKFEDYVIEHGGKKIVGETSGRELYKPTRDFYVKNGYKLVAEIPDYYSIGDSRVTIVKDVG